MSNKMPGCHLANAWRSRLKHILQWRYRNEVSAHSWLTNAFNLETFCIKVYSFIEITSDISHMFTIKELQVIRNTAHRPSTQASYTIGSGTTMQENQQAAQIAAKHNIIPQMAPYMSWIFLVLVGIDPGVSHLGGEIVSHNTTDARHHAESSKAESYIDDVEPNPLRLRAESSTVSLGSNPLISFCVVVGNK